MTMTPKLKTLNLLALIASLAYVLMPHPVTAEQKRKYAKTVPVGTRQVRVDDTCMTLHASLWAQDFFDTLEKITTPQRIEFRKKSDVVRTFPETIYVRVRAFNSKCSAGPTTGQETVAEMKLMESLHFEASWVRDSETRAVSELSVKRSSKISSAFYHDWIYDLPIPSRDVPLTDHLEVSIITRDGNKIASFTAVL